MIGFRVDSNKTISIGHIMRCMTIAKALISTGEKALIISSDENGRDIADRYHVPYTSLNTSWDRPDEELPQLCKALKANGIMKLVVDKYQVTSGYLASLSDTVKVLYIDDLNAFVYPVNALLNYNIYASRMNYEDAYCGTHTKLYLGCTYAPLREEFRNVNSIIREKAENVLITTGGSDPFGFSELLLGRMLSLSAMEGIRFHIIVGPFSNSVPSIEALASTSGRVFIHRNVSNMSKLMLQCDLAITASGSTMYELCACGVPSVSFSFADNQISGAKEFDRLGLIKYCGDIRGNSESCFTALLDEAALLISNHHTAQQLSKKMQAVVDGKGAFKIVDALVQV